MFNNYYLQYTREPGFLSYYEVCEKLQSGWTRVWDNAGKVPYAYYGNEWVGFEDPESLKIKVFIFINASK